MPRSDTVANLETNVRDFLYDEAALLDEGRFVEWLELFAPDAHYWIPAAKADIDPTREVSIVYDDHAFLSERVWRFQSGLAYAQEPTSSTSHLVGNIRLGATTDDQLLPVDARFQVVEFRRGAQTVYAGRFKYLLRDVEVSRFQIVLKKVELINLDGHLGNLSMIL